MVSGWSQTVFEFLNGVSGRSFTLDALLALILEDPVAKAGPIVACFAYAWWQAGPGEQNTRRRRILLVTLASLFVIAPVMKALSSQGFAPRPLVRSEQVYALGDSGDLRALPRLAYRPPHTGDAGARHAALRARAIEPNDLGSFPSDHAALFLALATGILLAARGAGVIALAWTLAFTLGARIATGLHSPLDIVAGGAIGVGFLLAFLAAGRLVPPRLFEAVLRSADRWPGLTAALLVLVLFEVANTMGTLKRLAELGGLALGVGA